MYITLTKIDRNADMGGFDAIEVTGKRLDSGKTWSKAFFANNDVLENKLNDFTIGEDVNVVLKQGKKNKKFWNIVDFKEVTEEEREMAKTPYDPSSSGKKTGSGTSKRSGGSEDKMTKAEWAEKDRLKSIAIAKAVGVKTAAMAGKTTPKAVMDFSDKILSYLLDTNLLIAGKDGDPLSPPD